MKKVLAFDVYGTLINTHGVVVMLDKWIGSQATAFSHTWRDKQLEYSFRRGLMQTYQGFSQCTADALQYSCQYYQIELSDTQQVQLLASYLTLPAFDDVKPALAQLKAMGVPMFAFSNGERAAVESLLTHAGLREYFSAIVSSEDVKSFKPDPAVYRHLLDVTAAHAHMSSQAGHQEVYLVSSNPFDVLGAMSSGLKAVWVKRTATAIFDPWGQTPTTTIETLTELTAL
ncbi:MULTISPECIES: haloacid dehalogenase type II [unclassified Shewanella]|uniref:haloacid dehalogenase type II n=1 Tax=unclassified Shewanella TaxID=196818 RepID=UPI000C7A92C9|nr:MULTISPECIES: haloacid dehalogenase type II [unclassified Shewanella]PKG55386.1 haloacid dehalogenase type II [Shewanella sp. GutDb-MelDb]PKG76122.1 haloacid dehalogenase type II [Shewanella sp. GutCb]